MEFWDINSLTTEELAEFQKIQKEYNTSFKQTVAIFSRLYPNKIKNLGELSEGNFKSETIDENGVHTKSGDDAFIEMIENVIKKNRKEK